MMTFDEAIDHARKAGYVPAEESVVVAAGVEVREWKFRAGTVTLSEIHEFDHLSILISGRCILRSNGEDRHLIGPCMVEIKAGIEHALYAISDVVWDCVRPFKGAN